MSNEVAEKVDNALKKLYKERWHCKNPFIFNTLSLAKGRGRKDGDLAWIMLKENPAHTEKSIRRGGGDFSGARG